MSYKKLRIIRYMLLFILFFLIAMTLFDLFGGSGAALFIHFPALISVIAIFALLTVFLSGLGLFLKAKAENYQIRLPIKSVVWMVILPLTLMIVSILATVFQLMPQSAIIAGEGQLFSIISTAYFVTSCIAFSAMQYDFFISRSLEKIKKDQIKINIILRSLIPISYFIFIPIAFYQGFTALSLAGSSASLTNPEWFRYYLFFYLDLFYFFLSVSTFYLSRILDRYKKITFARNLLLMNYVYLLLLLVGLSVFYF